MVRRKQRRADSFRLELENAGVDYRVLAISAFGRFHPEFLRVLTSIAKAHSRRRGTEAAVELRHVQCRIAVSVWRRAAKMVRACTPGALDDEDGSEAEPLDEAVLLRRGHPCSAPVESLPPAVGSTATAGAPAGT